MQNHSDQTHTIRCLACHRLYQLQSADIPRFCPMCGHLQSAPLESRQELAPSYQIMENIGKGGMGEVFAAFDPQCKRRIALKRIRLDLLEHPQIRHRFLKEAHITCQLTHPAIIPIYAIQSSPESVFYTMPLVEGETLKQILRKTRRQEKKGEKLDHIGGSIPALMRIFVTVCQAVAYAHSKGILHRDLKPENVIVGKYGEVLILDWGLAKWIDQKDEDEFQIDLPHEPSKSPFQTRAGKIVGTIAYMAPERAIGERANIQTDIYALGVMLYQILALKNPFQRGSLEEFRKTAHLEKLTDPIIAAPHRDVPKMLAQCTLKCLAKDPKDRYHTVDELIHDLETYVEGRSEWFHMADLDINEKADWEFQENVLLAEHIAITRTTEETEWVSLMISHQSFAGNTKLETTICLGPSCRGIGLLFSIPEISERTHLNEGYCLWLGSDSHRTTRLLRSNVEIMLAPDIYLKRDHRYKIRIEKIEKSIHFYIDDALQFSYLTHLPLIGTHIGLLSRDADFNIQPIQVFVGSLNLTVNCLAVPDAFLAHHDYPKALSEYRRIAYSFPDRPEGREALFRAGLTFIEQAKKEADPHPLLDEALQEFEKLHGTPGAPLQYLGKGLVYQIMNENEEEVKCFELAYRRYPNHPLLLVLQEQILSRMHEVSRQQRLATYRFILLTVRHLPESAIDTHTRRLFTSLQKHWEALPFITEPPLKPQLHSSTALAIPLTFWLAKPYGLGEIIDELIEQGPAASTKALFTSSARISVSREESDALVFDEGIALAISEEKNRADDSLAGDRKLTDEVNKTATSISNALFSLLELGAWEYASNKLNKIQAQMEPSSHWTWLEAVCACHQEPLQKIAPAFLDKKNLTIDPQELRALLYFMDQALDQDQTALVHQTLDNLTHCELSFDSQLKLNARRLAACLLENDWQTAGEIFSAYPAEFLNKDSTIMHFLYACWLQATEGKEAAQNHLMRLLLVSYPRTWTLASHYLIGHLSLKSNWYAQAFLWEKKQLFRQLVLYYHCARENDKKLEFLKLYQEQTIHVDI